MRRMTAIIGVLLAAGSLAVSPAASDARDPGGQGQVAVPLTKWTESVTMEGSRTLKPPYGKWEETGGTVTATGRVERWSTMLAPGDQGANQRVDVRFAVEKSAGAPLALPGGCVRWGFYWGENFPGWDFGVVLRFKDPLHFYRVQVSATRGQLALWDSTGGFLQIIPCAIKVKTAHTLTITARGAHFQAAVDGRPVMDYWDRTLPHEAGQVGLAVYHGRARVERFAVEKVAADPTTMPPHKPDFRFETLPSWRVFGGRNAGKDKFLVLFDGHEPISYFWTFPANHSLFHDGVKLRPGWRPAYYTTIGPCIYFASAKDGQDGWPALVGELPGALSVAGGGETISWRLQTEHPRAMHTDHAVTVRYDAKRGVYRYEYRGKTRMLAAKTLHMFELIDPLTYNNRTPGPAVVHRWNPAGHRWNVYQGPGGVWLRYPAVDYLRAGNNPETNWGRFRDFLYPDPAVCPAFETEFGWARAPGRYFKLSTCTWGYDYHHAETGRKHVPLPAGAERPFSVTLTGLPRAEADAIFARSQVTPAVAKQTRQYVAFDPRGTTFADTFTLGEAKSTMAWDGTVDKTTGRTDHASLRIDGPGQGGLPVMYQYIVEEYAQRWWVRGWFKTKGVRGRGLELRLKHAYVPRPMETFYLGGVGEKEWTHFSFITKVPRSVSGGTAAISMTFELDGPGQAWLDDVAFSALKEGENPPVTIYPVPAGLEPSKEILIDLPVAEPPCANVVYDESRNGHALVLSKSVAWKQEDGRGYLHFNGTNASGKVDLQPALEKRDAPPALTPAVLAKRGILNYYKPIFPLKQFTYEFWVRPEKPAKDARDRMGVFSSGHNPVCTLTHLFDQEGGCRLYYQNDVLAGEKIRFEQAVPYHQWLHVVVTHGDGRVILYLNGKKTDDAKYDPKGAGFLMHYNCYHIGYPYGPNSRLLFGDLGPFRLYARAFKPEEVADRYRTGWPRKK